MRISKLWAILAPAALLLALQLSTPTPAHADTFNIVASWAENTWGFYGITSSGDLYLNNSYSQNQMRIVSRTGNSTITTSNLPLTFIQDRGSICQESLAGFTHAVSGVCNGNIFAFLYAADGGPDTSLYRASGTGTAQLVTPAYNGDLLAVNSLGDIVFDNGFFDQAYYVVDLPTSAAPEPSALFLLGTGILAPLFFLRSRHHTARAASL